MRDLIFRFCEGKTFTFMILGLYGLRCSSYLATKHYGPASYWLCAFGITVSAEFLMRRFP
jgi:hypothetical protein